MTEHSSNIQLCESFSNLPTNALTRVNFINSRSFQKKNIATILAMILGLMFFAAAPVVAQTTVLTIPVVDGDDDAEEGADGSISRNSSDLEMTQESSVQTVGLRFSNVTIPPGATIVSAFVQFTADQTDSRVTNLTITGEASDDAQPFVNTNGNISTRPRTNASASWNNIPVWNTVGENGAAQQTTDLKFVIEEIISQPGWIDGNALALVFEGEGKRVAESFNGGDPNPAELHVEFSTDPLPNQAPLAQNDEYNVTEGQTLSIAAPGLLENDNDPDNGPSPLTAAIMSLPTSGTVSCPAPSATDDICADGSFDYTPDSGTVLDSLTYEAFDGDLNSETVTVTINVVPADAVMTISIPVGDGDDDAEEMADGKTNTGSSDIEMTKESTTQTVGFRFFPVNIPAGATIVSAFVQFTADQTNATVANLTIAGEAIEDAQPFARINGNITSRQKTTASASWNNIPAWGSVGEAGAAQQTTDLTVVIQEIVDQAGWLNGNALALIIDGDGKRVAESFNGGDPSPAVLHVEFVQPNQPPVLATIGDQSINGGEGEELFILFSATDPDGDNLTFSTTDLPTFCELALGDDGDVIGLFCAPTQNDEGSSEITVTVTDDGTPNLTDSEDITLIVNDVNQPPVLAAISDQSVDEGETLAIPLSATDPDGDNLTFSNSNSRLPSFCTLTDNGDGTGSIDCSPGFSDAGVVPSIEIVVTDDGSPNLNNGDVFTLTVNNVNRAPVLAAIGDQAVDEGETLSIAFSATDPDGDNLTFSTSIVPSFCSLTDNDNGTGSIDCSPGFADSGTASITVTMTDNGTPNLSDEETFTLTVGDVNQPPVLAAIGNQAVDEGQALNITLSATDPEGNSLTFSTSTLPSFCFLIDNDNGTSSIDCSPGSSDAGTPSITVTVTDDGTPNLTDEETFTLTVEPNLCDSVDCDDRNICTTDECDLADGSCESTDNAGCSDCPGITIVPLDCALSPNSPQTNLVGSCDQTINGNPSNRNLLAYFDVPTNAGDDKWIRYDLGSSRTVNGLRYVTDWHNKGSDNWEVWATDDPENTPENAQATLVLAGVGGLVPQGANNAEKWQRFVLPEFTARYVYFKNINTYDPTRQWVLYELTFCGPQKR